MKITVSTLRDIKRAVTVDGDIASDIAFQNDVNAMLAVVARLAPADLPVPAVPRPVRVVSNRARSSGRR